MTTKENEIYDKMQSHMDFSNWLIDQIKDKGWSQAELARRAGIPRQIISNYVNNKREKPDPDVLIAIARALNLPPETVFRAAGLLPPVSPDTEYQEQILHLLRQLPPEEQKRYLELLQFEVERQKSKITKTSREKPPARTLLKR